MSCDVTSVVATAQALRFLSQCLEHTLIDMFAQIRQLFQRTNVDAREIRERRKEAGLSSESNKGQSHGECGVSTGKWILSFLPVWPELAFLAK